MITSKACIKCHKTKKVSNYYINKDNKRGYGIDNFCKECSRKTSSDLSGLKEYCESNNRLFSSDLYESVSKSVNTKYEHDLDFNSLDEVKRELFLTDKIIKMYFSRMGNTQYYQYIPDEEDSNFVRSDEELEDEIVEEYEDDIDSKKVKGKDKRTYSQDWRGSYTKNQIDWLDAYYADTLSDYTVKTRNHKDYCRKIAKASLAMDEASNEMLNNVPGAEKKYDKAKAAFDLFSSSAKLSEKTRSANEVSGLSSISEIVARLEQTGFLQKKITFEKDSIDQVGEDFRWTLTSVGGEL